MKNFFVVWLFLDDGKENVIILFIRLKWMEMEIIKHQKMM